MGRVGKMKAKIEYTPAPAPEIPPGDTEYFEGLRMGTEYHFVIQPQGGKALEVMLTREQVMQLMDNQPITLTNEQAESLKQQLRGE